MNKGQRQRLADAVDALRECLDDIGGDIGGDSSDDGSDELDDEEDGVEMDDEEDGGDESYSDRANSLRMSYDGMGHYTGTEPQTANYVDRNGKMDTARFVADMVSFHCPAGSSDALVAGTKLRALLEARIEEGNQARARAQQQTLALLQQQRAGNLSGPATTRDGSAPPPPPYTSTPAPATPAQALRYGERRAAEEANVRMLSEEARRVILRPDLERRYRDQRYPTDRPI